MESEINAHLYIMHTYNARNLHMIEFDQNNYSIGNIGESTRR